VKKRVIVHLFGKICIENEYGRVDEDQLHSTKLAQLLAYIVMNRGRILSHENLIEIFWDNSSRNPVGALKNLMYRLRTALKPLHVELICTMSGAYYWNPDVEVELDCEKFEHFASLAKVETDPLRQKTLCQKAMNCFGSNFSDKLKHETWILPKETWYQSLYQDLVKILGALYEEEGAWEKLEFLCNKALHNDQMDEDVHYWIIRSLYEQRKYDLAMDHYEKVSRMLYGELGVSTSERLRSVFHEVIHVKSGWEMQVENIVEELEENTKPDSVFFCDYAVFRQIYRLTARQMARLNIPQQIVLLTVRRIGGVMREPAEDSGLQSSLELLEALLSADLRIGDVAARYNMTQYVILLSNCEAGMADKVICRIQKQFAEQVENSNLLLFYEQMQTSVKE
jgi:DNA-binding SARP family transcriptional activator